MTAAQEQTLNTLVTDVAQLTTRVDALTARVDALATKVEQQDNTINALIAVVTKLSNVMEQGFDEVNQRLSRLEGIEGMKGVHTQLGDIKSELKKINSVTRYDDEAGNFDIFKKGEA